MTDIKIENVSKKIKSNMILKNIDMELTSGHIYGFRGKNGCGKTMLMRCICGLIIPTEGKIIINGKELHKDIKIPESIGALIENPAFLPQYTGFKNLKMLASLKGKVSDEEVKLAIKRAGLDPNDKKTYKKYSL